MFVIGLYLVLNINGVVWLFGGARQFSLENARAIAVTNRRNKGLNLSRS